MWHTYKQKIFSFIYTIALLREPDKVKLIHYYNSQQPALAVFSTDQIDFTNIYKLIKYKMTLKYKKKENRLASFQ